MKGSGKEVLYQSTLEHKTYQITAGKDEFILIPCYPTLLLKTLKDMDVKNEVIKANVTLIMRFLIQKNLPEPVKEKIKSRVDMRIGEEAIGLEPNKTDGLTFKISKQNDQEDLYVFTYRATVDVPFEANLRRTPFDIFITNLEIELTSDFAKLDEKTECKYRFNMHECLTKSSNLAFKEGFDKVREFDTDQATSGTKLIREHKAIKGVTHYSYYPKMEYNLVVCRLPYNLLVTIILPIFLLQLMLLVVFAQENEVASKLGNIATIILALVAYLPTVRSAFPSVPYFTLTDAIVYTSIWISLTALLETVLVHFDENINITYALFAIAGFGCLCNVMVILYKLQRHTSFRLGMQTVVKKVKQSSDVFDKKEWKNDSLKTVGYPVDEVQIKEL